MARKRQSLVRKASYNMAHPRPERRSKNKDPLPSGWKDPNSLLVVPAFFYYAFKEFCELFGRKAARARGYNSQGRRAANRKRTAKPRQRKAPQQPAGPSPTGNGSAGNNSAGTTNAKVAGTLYERLVSKHSDRPFAYQGNDIAAAGGNRVRSGR